MQYELHDHGHERFATIDIETTHYDPGAGEVVAIGIGLHSRNSSPTDATYQTFYREAADDESATIIEAVEALNALDADALVTYNGHGFDVPFLTDRLERLGADVQPIDLANSDAHIDLFIPRKRRAEAAGEEWPGLEGCLESYGLEPPVTLWDGQRINNGLFGDEIGPAYLDAVVGGENDTRDSLRDAIEHYLITDLEANFALYSHDIGQEFDPQYDGDRATFNLN